MMAIFLAYVFSKMVFSTYEAEQVMNSSGNIYLLQYGSYISKDVLNENIKKLNDYLVFERDNKYYVYLGAYTNIDTAKKMQKYFINQSIYTYLKDDYISDMSIIDEITKYDHQILNEKDYSKIIFYNRKILDILKRVY